MKKYILLYLLIGFNVVYAQQKEPDRIISPWLRHKITEYKPLRESSLSPIGFLDLYSQTGDCDELWEYYLRFTCYPSGKLTANFVEVDSLPFLQKNFWGASLAKMIIHSIVDSLYISNSHPGEIRFESQLPQSENLTKKEHSQQLHLHPFVPDNDRLYGLLSDPIDILHGARLQFVYNMLDHEKKQIFIDHEQPLTYEIKSIKDSVCHTFGFKFKDVQFDDVLFGHTEINFLPPVQYDVLHVTKDSLYKTLFLGDEPAWVFTFEKGMLHLIYHTEKLFEIDQVHVVKDGKSMLLKNAETMSFRYFIYDFCRKNSGLTRNELCELYNTPEEIRCLRLDHQKGETTRYGTFIAVLGDEVDEVYFSKEHEVAYDEILGSRIIGFGADSSADDFHYYLLKKDADGVLRMLHEDTTRTSPHYEGLDEEISKNLEYPKGAWDGGSEALVLIAVMVKTDGTMSDVRLFSDPWDHLLDEEALRVVKLLKNKWVPATLHGEPVDMQVIIPIRFDKK